MPERDAQALGRVAARPGGVAGGPETGGDPGVPTRGTWTSA